MGDVTPGREYVDQLKDERDALADALGRKHAEVERLRVSEAAAWEHEAAARESNDRLRARLDLLEGRTDG